MLLARLALAVLETNELSRKQTRSCMTYMSVVSYICVLEDVTAQGQTFTHFGMLTIVVGVGVGVDKS